MAFLDNSGVAYLWGKIKASLALKANAADLATVATSGSYNDLTDKPTIPSGGGSGLPDTTNASAGDFLKLDSNKNAIWSSEAISVEYMTASDIDTLWGSIEGLPNGDEVSY